MTGELSESMWLVPDSIAIFHLMFFIDLCSIWEDGDVPMPTTLPCHGIQIIPPGAGPSHVSQASFKHSDPETKVRCQSSLGKMRASTCPWQVKIKKPEEQQLSWPRQVTGCVMIFFRWELTDQSMPSFLLWWILQVFPFPSLLTDGWWCHLRHVGYWSNPGSERSDSAAVGCPIHWLPKSAAQSSG